MRTLIAPSRVTSNARGFSLIGILVSMAIMVLLFAVLVQSLSTAWSGAGSTVPNSARSIQDQFNLQQIHQLTLTSASEQRDRLPAPSLIDRSFSTDDNTTANFWSLMLTTNGMGMQTKMLISGNEHNPYVWADEDYNYDAYYPGAGVYWDPNFKADLNRDSNVSFAHLVLYGKRFDRSWKTFGSSTMPLIGNRGPRDGQPDPRSYTYGKDGTWAGFAVFADNHVAFLDTFTPGGVVFEMNGQSYADNIFALEDGPAGNDVILTFTERMTREGPVMQFD